MDVVIHQRYRKWTQMKGERKSKRFSEEEEKYDLNIAGVPFNKI